MQTIIFTPSLLDAAYMVSIGIHVHELQCEILMTATITPLIELLV